MMEDRILENYFGLGAVPGTAAASSPRDWLERQFANYRPAIAGNFADRAAIGRDLANYQDQLRTARQAARADDGAEAKQAQQTMRAEARQLGREQYLVQIGARFRGAVASQASFVDRLVHFWANHFAVSADKLTVIGFAGLMEFEAIRPHVLGRFEDMLAAVEQHPAMLIFLDQAQSIGPNSPIGQRARGNGRNLGLNENLGREILELHSLGARSGYSQADVTELARALTGWTVAGVGKASLASHLTGDGTPGDFVFADLIHEPGARTIMGTRYDQRGAGQARAVLTDLARHPATARHIATKLARHFVADDPPTALVDVLAKAFLDSGGDLPTVYRALIDASAVYDASAAYMAAVPKFRSPWLWGVASFRAMIGDAPARLDALPDKAIAGMFVELGQPVWRPGSPAGFDDIAASWAGPDALYRRVEVASRFAARANVQADPRALAKAIFGDRLSESTAASIAGADSPTQGMALLMLAPEMMRC